MNKRKCVFMYAWINFRYYVYSFIIVIFLTKLAQNIKRYRIL